MYGLILNVIKEMIILSKKMGILKKKTNSKKNGFPRRRLFLRVASHPCYIITILCNLLGFPIHVKFPIRPKSIQKKNSKPPAAADVCFYDGVRAACISGVPGPHGAPRGGRGAKQADQQDERQPPHRGSRWGPSAAGEGDGSGRGMAGGI